MLQTNISLGPESNHSLSLSFCDTFKIMEKGVNALHAAIFEQSRTFKLARLYVEV